jgi:biopolymer transport protein ExbD
MWWASNGPTASRRRRKNLEIAITPLIDIVFLLLIFFMLTSRFVAQEGIEVDLPVTERIHTLNAKDVNLIFLKEDGMLFFKGKMFTVEGFKRELALRGDRLLEKPFEIRSDRRTPVQSMVLVLEALRDAGARKVTVGTLHESPGRPGP